jgi:hypothetical protein
MINLSLTATDKLKDVLADGASKVQQTIN